jgi:hypothetical protein
LVREVEECVDEIATLSADDTGEAGRCILLSSKKITVTARTSHPFMILDVKAGLDVNV